jgi:arylsulfatase A-like enzyme
MTLFGQATLAARRLVEAGARIVTVFWDEYNLGNSAWDTHVFLVNRMRDELCPGFDRAFSALMQDLDERGLLSETLVCVMSEHGRTPRFTDGTDGFGPQGGGGRDHWSRAYCNLFAGAGIREGAVIGKTDAQGGEPEERPVSPKDVLCTLYHLLGIDPHSTITGRDGRPLPLVEGGEVMRDLIA